MDGEKNIRRLSARTTRDVITSLVSVITRARIPPVFQKYSAALAAKLAERYGSNPHVKCWHVNNEYGGTCYCENCEKAFRVWVRKKYGTLDAVNKAWNMEFWGHTLYDWDEIVAPNALSEGIGTEKQRLQEFPLIINALTQTAFWKTISWSGMRSAGLIPRLSSPQT